MPETLVDLDVVGLTLGGRGIGRHDGLAVFVPYAAPGDRVRCRIVARKRRHAEAEIVTLLSASPQRVAPPCPHFGDCGGCQWQHLDDSTQVFWKERLFADTLQRPGLADGSCFQPIAAAPTPWRYRSRVQFKCHATGDGLLVGFYRSGSHYIADVPDCLLLAPPVQNTLELLRRECASAPNRDAIPQIDVGCGADGTVRVVVHVLPEAVAALRPWLRDLARAHSLSLCLQCGRKDTLEVLAGEDGLSVTVDEPPLTLRYGPGGFAQVNPEQNRRLVAELCAALDLQGNERILDLFCGMGNFSLPLARRAREVVGVEDYAPAIADARTNATANGLDNVDFRAGDASRLAAAFPVGHFDVAVLDPPRTGSYSAARDLLRLQPRRIAYVSCDPATLARDLTPLVHGGYRVVSARAFDLFPQTWHVESLTLLERDEGG